jgi:hypothetical protein
MQQTFKSANIMLKLNYALAAIAAQKNNKVTAARITAMLQAYNNTATIANVTQVTQVQTSAANKHVVIHKVTKANVLLFANALNYVACVQRSAAKQANNDLANIANFTASAASFTHDANCYSLVTNNNNAAQQYLYLHYNNAQSVYVLNNTIITAAQAASYCSASVAKTMLNSSSTTHNVSNNVTHSITVRTVKLQNIVRIAALKQVLQ